MRNKVSRFLEWVIFESDTIMFVAILALYVLTGVLIGLLLFTILSMM